MKQIRLRGAREHNLRGVDLDLPAGRWICVTGPSGSGKSSLVFDTLVREGQHRYLGALSALARQFFGKLGSAKLDSVEGLPPAIAIGSSDRRASSRSTVGTLTGVLDLLRLLYARVSVDPGGELLSRSHFSFNHPIGACSACSGSGVEDRVEEDLLIADSDKSLRQGALVPTLPNGYTVYSQVTLEVMDTICRAHGFDVDTPWRELTADQRQVIFYGTRALEVPFGKHSIESRMKWEGITARPREVGFYKGLIPVIEETLKRNRNPNILRFVRSVACSECDGTRLARPGREAAIGGWTLPALLRLPARELSAQLVRLPGSAVLSAVNDEIARRLEGLNRLGLGHLSLERHSTTLSAGEAQRLQLASRLAATLSGLLIALDEPTLGLHPSGQEGMRLVLEELRDAGNTLLVVEHDPQMAEHGDYWVAIGPGAGPAGGRVVECREMPAHPLGVAPAQKAAPREARDTITLRGATLHNLRRAELTLHLGTFQVITGPSGAGKSSLVFGTLLPALAGTEGGPFESLEGEGVRATRAVDARPIGRTSRSTPATWSGLMDLIRQRFASTELARERGFKAGHFSFNNKQGRCPECEGIGYLRVGLHLLDDVELPCGVCDGRRYTSEVLEVLWNGKTVAEVLALSVEEACEFFVDEPVALAICHALEQLGLGYLSLGFPSNRLSRGEAQRVKLATLLGNPTAEPTLLALDEPDRGLHPEDVKRLLACIDDLVEAGHTVLAISHHRHLWAAADVHIELTDGVARRRETLDELPPSPARPVRKAAKSPDEIRLVGVRTHNLAGIDVSIPHGKLTAVCGVSGSGKSSLAFDTLAAEAWRRFAESLPFQVRRFLQRMPRPDLESASGLGPVLALRQNQARATKRSTVATQSELGPLLRLLWSRTARIDGKPCELSAEHFSTERALGACDACAGAKVVSRCDPDLLITHPDQSILAGAMNGTRVGRYLGEADGQFLATLRAAAPHVNWELPWLDLDDEQRELALHGGDGELLVVPWKLTSGKRVGEGKEVHEFEASWDGLLVLAEREARRRAKQKSAASWAEPLADAPCANCAGTGLNEQVRAARIAGLSLPELLAQPIGRLLESLESLDLDKEQTVVFAALLPELQSRTSDLVALGLGHLQLDRQSPTLSTGELQRTRLAGVLRSGLTGVTLVLDEPTRGLHAQEADGLVDRLREFLDAGNTVIVVEHEPRVLRSADYLIQLGPGAGARGGEVVARGSALDVLAAEEQLTPVNRRGSFESDASSRIHLRGCHAHHLKSIDVDLPVSGLVAVTGVSGSGKSTLVFDVLEASIRRRAAIGCESVEVSGGFERFVEIRSSSHATESQSIASALDCMPGIQRLYHAEAAATGLSRQAFSFNSPAGRCSTCHGTGRERVAMDFMADLDLACPSCEGRRYRPEVLEVLWQGLDVARFLDSPVAELLPLLPRGKLRTSFEALERVGLEYLAPGRRIAELSGGELQRVTLAASLVSAKSPTLYLLDEPAAGLHESDVARLTDVLRELGDRGDLVVIAEHRLSLIANSDYVVDLGPVGGEEGGNLVDAGAPRLLTKGATAACLASTHAGT